MATRVRRASAAVRRGTATVAALALASGLSACAGNAAAADPPAPTGALAIVVGAHGNMPHLDLAGQAADAAQLAVDQQSFVTLVVADGAPYEAWQPGVLAADGNATDRQQQRVANRRALDDAIASAHARTPQADLIAALDLAAQALRAHPGPRTLVVLDSGLSTAGALDFTKPGMLDADPQEVADSIANANLLPNLKGISVVLSGIGETADPQQPLTPVRQARLQDIWRAITQSAGATSTEVDRTPPRATPATGLPPVNTVPVPPTARCENKRVTLSGGEVSFRPDTGFFVDPTAATATLRPFAQQIMDRHLGATIFGTSAQIGDQTGRRKLSGEQAQSVADTFIRLGVPVAQLRVEGLGSDWPGLVQDRDAAGHLDPAAAALNRTVFIDFTAPVTCG